MNCHIVTGRPDIKLSHHGPAPLLGHHVDNLVKFDEVHRKFIPMDATVHTRPPWGGEINSEPPFTA